MINRIHKFNSYLHEKHLTRYTLYFFFLLSFMIFGLPYVMHIFNLDLIVFRIYVILVLISSIFLSQKALIRKIALVLITIFVTLLIHHDNEIIFLQLFRNLCLSIFLIVIFYEIIEDILKSEISIRILFQALNGYLLLGLIAAEALKLIHLHDVNSFNFSPIHLYNHVYLSFVLISSVGLGDLVPLTTAAKSIVVLISVLGQMYNLFFTSVIIGKYVGMSMKK